MEEAPISEAIQTPPDCGYDLLPANADLTGAEVALVDELGRELRLRSAIAEIAERYEFIIIDCPPALNMLTINALVAAGSVVIPTQCEYYALEGLSALLETVEKIKKVLNPELKVEGFLRTMFDPRNNLANQVSQQLLKHFGDKVYKTVIPRNLYHRRQPGRGASGVSASCAARQGAQQRAPNRAGPTLYPHCGPCRRIRPVPSRF